MRKKTTNHRAMIIILNMHQSQATSNVAFFGYIDHIHQTFATHITRAQFGYNRLIELNRVFGSSRVRRNTHGQYRMLTNNSALIVISLYHFAEVFSFLFLCHFLCFSSTTLYVKRSMRSVSLLYNRSFFSRFLPWSFFSPHWIQFLDSIFSWLRR